MFRLKKVPIDDLSIMLTFLAVKGDVNTALQAQGKSIVDEEAPALAEFGMAAASLGESLQSRIARTAQHIDSLAVAARQHRAEGPKTKCMGDRDSIFIESMGRGVVTVLSVKPQHLAKVGPDQFEREFNHCLNHALQQ